MSQPRHPPRDYQIEELMRGVERPLPALKPRYLTILPRLGTKISAWHTHIHSVYRPKYPKHIILPSLLPSLKAIALSSPGRSGPATQAYVTV